MTAKLDRPSTKADVQAAIDRAIDRMEKFVLDREAALIWKVIALQVTLIAAIAGAQWAALLLVMQHLQWKP